MRLTKKFRNIYVYNFDKNCDFEERKERSIETHNKIIDKCGQLEDIEDELGIDLITLFKAVKNGIYVWFEGRIGENLLISFKDKAIIHIFDIPDDEEIENPTDAFNYFFFKDYGKKWALTREELE